MSVPVTYYCPRCGAVHELARDGYLADKTVTPYPLEGWHYVDSTDDFDADDSEANGVRIVCGDADLLLPGSDLPAGADAPDEGCGDPFYLSFVRFEDGKEVEPVPDADYVTIGAGESPPGPMGPRGPGPGRGA